MVRTECIRLVHLPTIVTLNIPTPKNPASIYPKPVNVTNSDFSKSADRITLIKERFDLGLQ